MAVKNYDKRIFRLLSVLNMLNARKNVSPTNLSEKFKISVRSVQRDLKLINEVGFPIYKDAEKGSYYFVEEFNLGQSRLTEKEWALILTFK
ncbi:MAG: HTH domain-containing protein, partial [Proteobacteria bacterium]|nr:HTH domain-containing protein [Pseudomonadota bacterium]